MSKSRLDEALSLLTQSPPGQTSQVYHDLRGILFDSESNTNPTLDDTSLQSAAAIALEEYNTSQLVTATLPSHDDSPVIICQAGQVSGTKRYLHPKLKKSFVYDHVKRTVTDVEDVEVEKGEAEEMRSALEKVLEEYVKDRYPDGVSSVFAVSSAPVGVDEEKVKEAMEEDAKSPAETTAATGADEGETEGEAKEEEMKDDPVEAVAAAEAVESSSSTQPGPSSSAVPIKTTYAIHHVGNRFNLSNFWSGRWRASYVLDPSSLLLTSTLIVQVHYFENGNVQLNAAKPRTFQLPEKLAEANAEELAKEVVKVVSAHEDGWQKALESSYDELAERAFKALRRQLPLTRQKVDWDKVLNYKLGDELSRA